MRGTWIHRVGSGIQLAVLALFTSLITLLLVTSTATALGLKSVTAQPAKTQAGSHENFHLRIELSDASDDIKDLKVHLPAGLLGNPRAVPRCTLDQFAADSCPAGTQVGETTVSVTTTIIVPIDLDAPGEVYNIEPRGNEPARLGIIVRPIGGLTGKLSLESPVTVRSPGDFGLDSTLQDLPRTFGGNEIDTNAIDLVLYGHAGTPPAPFLTNSTECVLATTTVEANSYAHPDQTTTGSDSFTPTGCADVPFTPGFDISADPSRADSPAAFKASITFPENNEPLQQSYLRNGRIVLPEGVALSPTVASGPFDSCSESALAPNSAAPAACPSISQVGEVTFDTPLLGTLHGKVFLGEPTPTDRMRLFIDVEDAGLIVKLIGSTTPNPDTGQLTTIFTELPRVPITLVVLTFNGGDHAVLTTPQGCGTFTATAQLSPWSGTPDATPSGSFTTSDDGAGAACPDPPPFQPTISASASTDQAGAETSVDTTITRPDRHARLASMKLALPPGLAGSIANIPMCPYTNATEGNCSSESRVGKVTVSSGGGAAPLSVSGNVYLAAPQAGGNELANFAIIIPAKVGPLDLGTVVSLARILVRSDDSGIDVTASKLPTMIAGIPLSVRSLSLNVDRAGFLTNATSCLASSVKATFTSDRGQTATAEAPYRPTGCEALPFKPKLAATLDAPGQTNHPSIKSLITQKKGEANTKQVKVTLPAGVGFDLNTLNGACKSELYDTNSCPASSKVGTAIAETPLLSKPLIGPARLVLYPNESLPKLAIQLSGQISVPLVGKIETGNRLVTTFEKVPDVPLTRFELALSGGKGSALKLVGDICKTKKPTIDGAFVAHSGKSSKTTSKLRITGCPPNTALSFKGLRRSHGSMKLKLAPHDRADAGTRTLKLTLPDGITTHGKPSRKRVAVLNGSKRITKTKVRFKGSTVTVVGLPKRGVKKLTLVLRPGTLRTNSKIRVAAGSKKSLIAGLSLADSAGHKFRLNVRAKAR